VDGTDNYIRVYEKKNSDSCKGKNRPEDILILNESV
jgi:hypothetical protein